MEKQQDFTGYERNVVIYSRKCAEKKQKKNEKYKVVYLFGTRLVYNPGTRLGGGKEMEKYGSWNS